MDFLICHSPASLLTYWKSLQLNTGTSNLINHSQVGLLHCRRYRTIRGSRWLGKLKGSFHHLNLDNLKGFCFFLVWGTCMLHFFQVGSCVFPAGRSKTLQVIMKSKGNFSNQLMGESQFRVYWPEVYYHWTLIRFSLPRFPRTIGDTLRLGLIPSPLPL